MSFVVVVVTDYTCITVTLSIKTCHGTYRVIKPLKGQPLSAIKLSWYDPLLYHQFTMTSMLYDQSIQWSWNRSTSSDDGQKLPARRTSLIHCYFCFYYSIWSQFHSNQLRFFFLKWKLLFFTIYLGEEISISICYNKVIH